MSKTRMTTCTSCSRSAEGGRRCTTRMTKARLWVGVTMRERRGERQGESEARKRRVCSFRFRKQIEAQQ